MAARLVMTETVCKGGYKYVYTGGGREGVLHKIFWGEGGGGGGPAHSEKIDPTRSMVLSKWGLKRSKNDEKGFQPDWKSSTGSKFIHLYNSSKFCWITILTD